MAKVLFFSIVTVFVFYNSEVYSAPSMVGSKLFSVGRRNSTRRHETSSDPTELLEIPGISEHDAEIALRNLGYNNIDTVDALEVGPRFADSTERSLEALIRNFQRENGLTETGTLDDETKLVINSPHCGSKKKSAKLTDDVTKWRKQSLTYKIQSFPLGKRQEPIRDIIAKAFGEWSKVTNLDFTEVTSANADIEIGFGGRHHRQRGDRCSFDDAKTLAHAFFPEVGDIHFNSNYFFDGDTTLEDFLDTALHEIGHSLGLDHSRSRASLMHPTESNRFTEPQPMDVQEIQALYGVRRGGRSISTSAPKLCSLEKIDAALDDAKGNTYILAGNYYYNPKDRSPTGKPISSKWPGLPGNIDAAFRYIDGRSYFFKGNKFWRFNNNRLEPGHPRLISKGFPGLPSNIDAILIDGDGDIFVFKGGQYWIYDTKRKRAGSARAMNVRQMGLPSNIDAALDTDTSIVVFKGNNHYKWQAGGSFKEFRNEWLVC